jgi:hypothetical protein
LKIKEFFNEKYIDKCNLLKVNNREVN